MKIVFDYELTGPLPSNTPLETYAALNKIREFVRQRLSVLQDEINKYAEARVVINMFKTVSPYPGIIYDGFTNNLKVKMKGCFSEQDFQYLAKGLMDA